MVDRAALEMQCTARYRGFESLSLRQMDNFRGHVGKVTWGHGVVSKCSFDLYFDTQVGAPLRGVR